MLLPSPLRAEPLDHIVAAVNYEVITGKRTGLHGRAEHAVRRRQAGPENDRNGDPRGTDQPRLLVQEARRLRFVDVTDQEISAENDKFRKQFGSDKALADFLAEQDMTAQEFEPHARRTAPRRAVRGKEGGALRTGEPGRGADLFRRHPAEFTGKRFPDVQKSIFAFLTDRKVGQQLDQYVAELRAKRTSASTDEEYRDKDSIKRIYERGKADSSTRTQSKSGRGRQHLGLNFNAKARHLWCVLGLLLLRVLCGKSFSLRIPLRRRHEKVLY